MTIAYARTATPITMSICCFAGLSRNQSMQAIFSCSVVGPSSSLSPGFMCLGLRLTSSLIFIVLPGRLAATCISRRDRSRKGFPAEGARPSVLVSYPGFKVRGEDLLL